MIRELLSSAFFVLILSVAPPLGAEDGLTDGSEPESTEVAAEPAAAESGEAAEPSPVPEAPKPGAADLVQLALDRLAAVQALVIASEDGLDEADRAELTSELVDARRSLEQALLAIGHLESGGDLRALLEEAGLVLSEGEKTAADEEERRRQGLSPERFQEVVSAITAVSFNEGRMQALKRELKDHQLTSSQAWSIVELFDFSRDRVEALIFLHPEIVDPENFEALLAGLKFESDRETVRSRLGLGG